MGDVGVPGAAGGTGAGGDWFDALARLRERGEAGVIVTLVATRGHAPRDAGAKMTVAADCQWGTIGGGNLEATALDRARALLAAGAREPETLELALNERAPVAHGEQCCGGTVTILLEPQPARPVVAIFGAGNVGLELARILARLELRIHVVDSRPWAVDPARLAGQFDGPARVSLHEHAAPEGVLAGLPGGAHVVLMTHDHAEDLVLCDAALRHGALGSIGLIGSSAKLARFRMRLRTEGHADDAIARIRCPIGLAEVPGKEPAVIAISVAAELVRLTAGVASAAVSSGSGARAAG